MPYKNPEDKRRWRRENKDRQKIYNARHEAKREKRATIEWIAKDIFEDAKRVSDRIIAQKKQPIADEIASLLQQVKHLRQKRERLKKFNDRFKLRLVTWKRSRKQAAEKALQRYSEDPIDRCKRIVRRAIHHALKGGTKDGSVWKHLPYTPDQLIEHLLATIPDGYTADDWTNGILSIDHIIPHSAFAYQTTDCPSFRRCWKLDNLRLIPARENASKSNRLVLLGSS